jgi:hypothetical protein
MADAPTLSPELSRGVLVLARPLVAAAWSGTFHPPDTAGIDPLKYL